jgi:hypothetical protein
LKNKNMESTKPTKPGEHEEEVDEMSDPADNAVPEIKVEKAPEEESETQQATQPPDDECFVPDDEKEGFDVQIKDMMQRKSMNVHKSLHFEETKDEPKPRTSSDCSVCEKDDFHIVSK